MKKLFISMMAAVMSLSAVADVTTTANIKLVGSNTTYANYTLRLKEDANRTNAYESGYDVESMMSLSNPFSVLVYGLVGDKNCEEVAAQNLDGLQIGFTTNMVDASYTLQFSNVSGRELKLYDLVEATETVIAEGESYNFSVEPSQVGQVAVTDRFVINYVPAPVYAAEVTTNEEGLATFSFSSDLQAVENVKLYKGAVGGETLTLTQVDYVKAGEGVIVYGEANTTYHFNAGTCSADFAGNELIASTAWEYPHANKDIFVLNGNMLYLYEGETMKPNKAFLQLAHSNNAPRRISLRFNQEQGIEDVAEEVQAEKFVENGQVFIRRGEDVYNLQGQIVK